MTVIIAVGLAVYAVFVAASLVVQWILPSSEDR